MYQPVDLKAVGGKHLPEYQILWHAMLRIQQQVNRLTDGTVKGNFHGTTSDYLSSERWVTIKNPLS